jgi:hypothetical protein
MLKKSFFIIILLTSFVLISQTANASYPVEKNKLIINSIVANITVSLVDGMQIAKIVFSSKADRMGNITLSPVEPRMENLEYRAGSKILKISRVTFQAAFGLMKGSITVSGSVTDKLGKNTMPFSRQIATWPSE